MNYSALIAKAKGYIQLHFAGKNGIYCFHDKIHTTEVVSAVEEMADYYMLSDEERFVVVCSAYFHDTGYLQGGSAGHEARSAKNAEFFLTQEQVSEEVKTKIKRCILSTKMPQSPENLLERILCDADLFHLGTASFSERNKLMHKEAEEVQGEKIDKALWRGMTIMLLKNHHYHTDYAQEKLGEKKHENLEELMKKEGKSKEKDERNKRPERGIETMFRISSSNNQRLSDMADNKANILLTVNSIILSMVVAVLLRRLDNDQHLVYPTIFLMVAVVLTMIFAILSTIPKIPDGRFHTEQVKQKKVNLLFFGNFYRMSYTDYEEGMGKVMLDSDLLYGMLTKDVYAQGVALGRKYRLLRYAYGIFMFGLTISVVAFSFSVMTL
ncbi:Pycsar system effector family protein [Sphingobacterium paludis]|uniref:Putative metal-dependent HD superfamily phosphohydrolase n=1 Tax=Sphingobacterium paludis TaxID=1476465 RepID=A0A4R7DAZ7_9SPHI|nr:Pycsar system effector family protein [Sphingobacterium paludis]TDS17441.1 putative metal-dependent HD superfamily phosphohydrolase [Sphingobacterium paludis]